MPDLLADDPLLAVLPREDGKPRLGPVVIEGVLGRGPMGALFLGRHVIIDVPVAIKTLSNTLDADTKKKFLSLMRRDAKYAARIRHPNIIGTLGYEEVGGQPFVSMEYVAGLPFGAQLESSQRSEGQCLGEAQALDLLIPIAEGLCEIWRVGIVHGDVKPMNILVPTEGSPKLIDLGLSRPLARARSNSARGRRSWHTAVHVAGGGPLRKAWHSI